MHKLNTVSILVTATDQVIADRLEPALSSFGISLIRCSTSIPTVNPVLVVWSSTSRLDPKIVTLATQAHNEGRLIQIGWRDGIPPTEFAPDGFVDMSAWRGGKENPRFTKLLEAVNAISNGRPVPAGVGNRKRQTRTARFLKIGAAAASISLGFLAFLADIGGTREFLCTAPSIDEICDGLGIKSSSEDANSELRQQITGNWGHPGCRRFGHFSFEADTLIQRWPGIDEHPALESRSQVEGYGKNILFVRDSMANKWTLTLNGRRMSIKPEGAQTETPLFKCG